MQLGIFMQPVHDPTRDYSQVLEQDRQTIILADQLGFAECWVGEHISATTEPITSPLIFLASLLQETSQIKLGTGVFSLSIKHPAIVAAEVALFDHLAKGRFLMGIGPGGLSTDLELFGVDGPDVDRSAMVQESIEIILGIWAGNPPYNIKGKNWEIQIEKLGRLGDFGVGRIPGPYQKPHPPIGVSIMSPNSMSAFGAGRNGWIPISGSSLIQPRYISSHWEKYVEGALDAGRPVPSAKIWRVCRSFMIAESDNEAEDYLSNPEGPYCYFYRYMISAFAERNAPWLNRPDGRENDDTVTWLDIARDMLAWGSPSTVLDKLILLREVVGDFGMLVVTANEWQDVAKDKRSMHLLSEEVMPKFRQHMLALREG